LGKLGIFCDEDNQLLKRKWDKRKVQLQSQKLDVDSFEVEIEVEVKFSITE